MTIDRTPQGHPVPPPTGSDLETELDWIEKRLEFELVPGAILKEYVEESNNQGVPWEGYTRDEMVAIAHFLCDLFVYQDNRD